jgi:hypothetical protein
MIDGSAIVATLILRSLTNFDVIKTQKVLLKSFKSAF